MGPINTCLFSLRVPGKLKGQKLTSPTHQSGYGDTELKGTKTPTDISKALYTFFTKPSKLKLKHSLGAYYNKNKCAKSPRDHFIDPQTQATFFVWENGHFQHLEMHISQHRGRSKGHPPVFRRPGPIPIEWYECHPFDLLS